MFKVQKSTIQCRYDDQATGCLNPKCAYAHKKRRNIFFKSNAVFPPVERAVVNMKYAFPQQKSSGTSNLKSSSLPERRDKYFQVRKSTIQCHHEYQPTGCLNPKCVYAHKKRRNIFFKSNVIFPPVERAVVNMTWAAPQEKSSGTSNLKSHSLPVERDEENIKIQEMVMESIRYFMPYDFPDIKVVKNVKPGESWKVKKNFGKNVAVLHPVSSPKKRRRSCTSYADENFPLSSDEMLNSSKKQRGNVSSPAVKRSYLSSPVSPLCPLNRLFKNTEHENSRADDSMNLNKVVKESTQKKISSGSTTFTLDELLLRNEEILDYEPDDDQNGLNVIF